MHAYFGGSLSLFVVVGFESLPPSLTLYYATGAVNPPRLQILRIDREGMIDDEISHGTLVHLSKKYS